LKCSFPNSIDINILDANAMMRKDGKRTQTNASVLSQLIFDNHRGAVPRTAPDALVRLWPTPEQRVRFEIIGSGSGIHWPEIDEDISVEGMLHGIPARRPASHHPSRR
jgi:hypothetical protein